MLALLALQGLSLCYACLTGFAGVLQGLSLCCLPYRLCSGSLCLGYACLTGFAAARSVGLCLPYRLCSGSLCLGYACLTGFAGAEFVLCCYVCLTGFAGAELVIVHERTYKVQYTRREGARIVRDARNLLTVFVWFRKSDKKRFLAANARARITAEFLRRIFFARNYQRRLTFCASPSTHFVPYESREPAGCGYWIIFTCPDTCYKYIYVFFCDYFA
jgi:hypothetical protein